MARKRDTQYRTFGVSLHLERDPDLIEWLKSQENVSNVIRTALYAYVQATGWNIVMPISESYEQRVVLDNLAEQGAVLIELMNRVGEIYDAIQQGGSIVLQTRDADGQQTSQVTISDEMIERMRQKVYQPGAGAPPQRTE